MKKIGKLFGMAALLCAAIVISSPGMAQEQKKQYRLEVVKVSAQKYEENVQDVPMSVGVLNDVVLEESGVNDILNLHKIVPNLYISTAGGSGTFTFMGIRGRTNSGRDIDPTVTVLVDGVPYDDFYTVGNNLLFDVERVEVLRGPQSTLYGLNSEAGVINLITKKPTDTMRITAYGEVGYGPDWDGTYTLGGSISGPIKEGVLKGGLSLMQSGQEGYIYNSYNSDRYNRDKKTGLSGTLSWTPTKAWDISGGLAYSKADENNGHVKVPYDEAAAAALPDGQSYGEWKTNIDHEGNTDVETWAPHLKILYQLDSVEFTSVTAYRNSSQQQDFDIDLTSQPNGYGYAKGKFKTLTQELRVQSTTGDQDDYKWLTGYFFHDFDRKQLLAMGAPPVPYTFMPFIDSRLQGNSHAVFGQGTYRFLDKKLGLTLGLRQEWTNRELNEELGYYDETTADDSQFLPKFAVDYRLTPEHMIYASVTQGWRSGGLNNMSTAPSELRFKKETCWAYEIGAKTRWLDDQVLFNASAFYTEYNDYQDLVRSGPLVAYLSNVPKVRMYGFETELQAQMLDSLFLIANLGYVNAKYVDFPDATAGDYDGNTVANVPDFNANLALKYVFLENFYIRPEVQGVGSIYWDRANTRKQGSYALLNLRAGYSKDNYDIYVFGENLTNHYAFQHANDFIRNGELYGTPITPMRVGVGISMEF